MSVSRLNVLPLLVDQFRSMRDIGSGKAAVLVRLAVLLVAPAAGATSIVLGWELHSVSELAAALGLLAGVFISAFAIVFSLRLGLAARPTSNLKQRAARLIDESALTLLAAGLLAGVDAVWVTVVSAANMPGTPVSVWPSAITVGLSALVATYFCLAIRRLHVLYVDTFPPYWKAQDAAGGSSVTLDIEEAARRVEQRAK